MCVLYTPVGTPSHFNCVDCEISLFYHKFLFVIRVVLFAILLATICYNLSVRKSKPLVS